MVFPGHNFHNWKHLVLTTLKNFAKRLPQNIFSRIHRSFIVPINKIDKVSEGLVCIGKKYIPISNSYKNEYDKYYPRPNIDSEHQNPLPFNINVHNYYTYENTEVNLLAFKKLIDIVQEDNREQFSDIIRPTEHIVFEKEFLVPMRSIIYSMLAIVNTTLYKEYVHGQKFKLKYAGLIFNPHMIRI